MYHDVSEFRNFYYQSRLGRSTQRRIQNVLKEIWPDPNGDSLVGFGFASPFLRPFRHRFKHIVNLMPEEQGAMAWPPDERNMTALCPETAWPLSAGFADRLLICHALECSENYKNLLQEIWRVSAPEGRVIFVVPNRLGIWASSEATPFGFGHPYSYSQIERFLKNNRFDVIRVEGALYAPPSESRFAVKSERFLEWALSGRTRRYFAGVLLVEATKHVGVMPPKIRKTVPIFANPALNPAVLRFSEAPDHHLKKNDK